MKILKPNRKFLQNEQHFQYMADVQELIAAVGADKLGIVELFVIFNTLFAQEDETMEFFRKSMLTHTITELDTVRDDIYRGICMFTGGFAHSKVPAERQAAANIQIVLDQYGNFRREDYNKETGTITKFVQDINKYCAEELMLLNLSRWVNDLEATNNDFKALMNERYDEQAAKVSIKLRDVRNQIDKVYTQMMTTIESTVTYLKPDDVVLTDFITRLNVRLVDYQKMIALHQTNMAKAKEVKTNGE